MEHGSGTSRKALILRLVGIWKLCKSVLVFILGIGLYRIMIHEQSGVAQPTPLPKDWFHRVTHWMIDHVHKLPPESLRNACIASFVYSVFFVIEGTGLLLRKRWAEWMVAITTSGLLPYELYEVIHKPTILRTTILLANIGIAAYFIYDLWRPRPTAGE